MNILYSGFDTINFALQGALEPKTIEALEAAKAEAIKRNSPASLVINGLRVAVLQNGQKGGYGFILKTGTFGAVISLKNNLDRKQWNGLVKIRSGAFTTDNWKNVFEVALSEAKQIGFSYLDHSINRVDYCIDFLTSAFRLNPDGFISHSQVRKSIHYSESLPLSQEGNFANFQNVQPVKEGNYQNFQPNQGDVTQKPLPIYGIAPPVGPEGINPLTPIKKHTVMKSDRVESITLGKMPSRQIILYDKLAEVKAKRKDWWFKVWNINREKFDRDPTLGVFRVEIRAGKTHLTSNNIRHVNDLEESIKNTLLKSTQAIRYIRLLPNDSNRSRAPLHPLWERVIAHIEQEKFQSGAYISKAELEEINLLLKKKQYMDLIMGNMAGYAACNPEQERTKVLEQLKHDTERDLTMRSMEKNSRFWASYFKAKDKMGV